MSMLSVDPATLRDVAGKLDVTADELRDNTSSCIGEADPGASSLWPCLNAVHELAAAWRSHVDSRADDLSALATNLRAAARSYEVTDADQEQAVLRAGRPY